LELKNSLFDLERIEQVRNALKTACPHSYGYGNPNSSKLYRAAIAAPEIYRMSQFSRFNFFFFFYQLPFNFNSPNFFMVFILLL